VSQHKAGGMVTYIQTAGFVLPVDNGKQSRIL
jgi:hypothetical protein